MKINCENLKLIQPIKKIEKYLKYKIKWQERFKLKKRQVIYKKLSKDI